MAGICRNGIHLVDFPVRELYSEALFYDRIIPKRERRGLGSIPTPGVPRLIGPVTPGIRPNDSLFGDRTPAIGFFELPVGVPCNRIGFLDRTGNADPVDHEPSLPLLCR
jgi:hypothetical protein